MSEESGEKQRLLIVDDSKVIRVTARKILQNHFTTVEAVDGENAWEILSNEEPFSLIVSDLTMPELDGFGLLERIRSSHLPHIQNIPVIVITGSNDSESVKDRATKAGATDFIGKPFDSVDLLARTQALAGAHTTNQTLTEENIALEEKLTTDPLTGLANESAFMGNGYQQLSYAVRHKTSLAVFRIEIDDFGSLFKQYGQEISESMIKAVATVLQAGIRHEDMAARIGTARFALLLPGMNQTGIRNLADRINRDISARILKQGETRIRFTVSIGVAAPDILRDTRFDELLSVADNRLVYASSRGGNQVVTDGAETKTPTPQEPCIEETTVPTLLEETASSTPELAETEVEVEVEVELQLEELVAFEVDESTDELTLLDEQPPAVECLTATTPDNQQPAVFAGPVSDMAADFSATQATDMNHSALNDVSGIPENTQNTTSASMPVDDHFISETIVVGVPGNDFLPYEYITESAHPTAATDASTEATSTESNTAANDEHTLVPDRKKAGKRPGFFKRLLSGIGSIFRRS